ncbi:FBP domain-containing protein [uncultured Jatrophihabitans sp.]|uniref:FBP domain-containing protein n=1 Tax=uncultured Jatrophihabitans sp. TaxID=1610747 RepID=UPI0035CC469A
MKPVSKSEIQRALVNVTKSERAALGVPADFTDVQWPVLDFYGWRDPKFPQRGYLVHRQQDTLVAIAVSTSGGGLAPGRKAMCGICHAVDNSRAVELFTARRTGPAGRAGNTVGTYICAGLDCSMQLRDPTNKVGRSRLDTDQDLDVIAAKMLSRLNAFLDTVRTN